MRNGGPAGHKCPGYEMRRINPAWKIGTLLPPGEAGFIRRNA